MPSGVSTYVFDATSYIGAKIRISGQTEYSVNYCGDGALYYLNAKGGFDAFLIEGRCTRTDNYTQSDIYKSYNNTRVSDFGRKRFLTDIVPSWKLVTGWLSDEESERLVDNLFPSTEIWFHNLKDDTIHPCVITDASVVHKTYSNQNNQMVAYEINIEYSQPLERR